jgi:low affinity Fe/Cu permease
MHADPPEHSLCQRWHPTCFMAAEMRSRGQKVATDQGESRSEEKQTVSDWFRRAAHHVTLFSGSWQFFLVSLIGIIVWASLGPALGYSDTWQLLVNTPTTVLTYLLGILILMEANRESREQKIVRDELLRAVENARTHFIDVDQKSEDELNELDAELRRHARRPSRVSEEESQGI